MKVIIVGCGRVGAELALQLQQDGHEVTVVDKDPKAFYRLGPGFKGATVTGVGFDREVLLRAGVERADALAAFTAGDNTNVITARVARNVFRVPKVVARVYDPRRAEIYQRLGLQTVSSTAWGVSRAMQLLVHPELNIAVTLGDGDVEVVQLEVPPHWVGHMVNHVNVPGEISIVALTRQDKTSIPTLGTVFQDGDRVAVAVLVSARGRLEELMALR
jgi:trk/ktr system potassium uptake protein